jgi:hypothetical protein
LVYKLALAGNELITLFCKPNLALPAVGHLKPMHELILSSMRPNYGAFILSRGLTSSCGAQVS